VRRTVADGKFSLFLVYDANGSDELAAEPLGAEPVTLKGAGPTTVTLTGIDKVMAEGSGAAVVRVSVALLLLPKAPSCEHAAVAVTTTPPENGTFSAVALLELVAVQLCAEFVKVSQLEPEPKAKEAADPLVVVVVGPM